MNSQWTITWTELASRSGDGLDVRLLWTNRGGADHVVVSVSDFRGGDYFAIPVDPAQALDVYYHPFAYRDGSSVDELGLVVR